MAGPTKQQTPVRRKPVVIQRHTLIAYRHVLRQQSVGLGFTQGLGRNDVTARRQDFATELRVEILEIGITAQHQTLGPHRSLSRMHPHFRAVIDPGYRAVFEQFHAQLRRGSGFTQRQVKRVQMTRAHVDQAADISVRADHTAHFIGLQQTGFVAISQAAQFFGFFGKTFQVARLVGQVAITPGQVAGNVVALDPLADDFYRLKAHQLHLPHTVFADDPFKLLKPVADAANQLPAIAPAGAPADLVRFEHNHAHATLGQLQRCVQAGKAAAHHAHISHMLTLQHRMIGLRQTAGGVIRSGVLAALIRGAHVLNPDYSC